MSLIAGILGGVVILDNVLAQIPAIKSNSTFQLLSGWLAAAATVFAPKA